MPQTAVFLCLSGTDLGDGDEAAEVNVVQTSAWGEEDRIHSEESSFALALLRNAWHRFCAL